LKSFLSTRIVSLLAFFVAGRWNGRDYYRKEVGCIFRAGNILATNRISMICDVEEFKDGFVLFSHIKDLMLQVPGGLLSHDLRYSLTGIGGILF
jgi:hypothetical protein